MTLIASLVAVATFVAAVLLTHLVRKFALARGVLDVPNERSSHVIPTPRGGGIATVAATSVALGVLGAIGELPLDLVGALVGGGLAIAAVGYIDDLKGLSPSVKFVVHVLAAVWALWWLGGLPPLQLGATTFSFGLFGYVLGVLGIVWTLNLFNFMDGIDGIAASEAVFVAVAGAWLAFSSAGVTAVPTAALIFAAGCAGLLVWNWPPAKIFMGDVGSGYMGYLIAVLAIAAARNSPTALLVWVILGAVFFVDATVTLVRRVKRGESASQAHRDHAYQKLARRWGNHRRVTTTVMVVNIVWLLPCGWLAATHSVTAGWILIIALLPILIGVIAAGAGRADA